jgi:hypothetical protein
MRHSRSCADHVIVGGDNLGVVEHSVVNRRRRR